MSLCHCHYWLLLFFLLQQARKKKRYITREILFRLPLIECLIINHLFLWHNTNKSNIHMEKKICKYFPLTINHREIIEITKLIYPIHVWNFSGRVITEDLSRVVYMLRWFQMKQLKKPIMGLFPYFHTFKIQLSGSVILYMYKHVECKLQSQVLLPLAACSFLWAEASF